MADRREILTVLAGKETISVAAEKAERGVEGLGDELRDTARDAKALDERIDEVNASLRDLASQYARTGDDAFVRQIRAQERELRSLAKARGLLGAIVDDGEAVKSGVRIGARMAEGVTKGLARAGGPVLGAAEGLFGSLPPKVQAAISAGVLAAASSVAPILGGAVAGAVVGGVGIGGVVGGLVIASRHQAVQAAAKETGALFARTMERAGVAFVPATLHSLGIVRGEIADLEDDFQRILTSASRFVRPLTEGVTGFAREVLPGLEAAIDRGAPVIDELASWGPRLGTMLSDIMEDFADKSDEASRALLYLWGIVEGGIRLAANSISTLAEAFKWADLLGAALTGDLPQRVLDYAVAEQKAASEGKPFSEILRELMGGFQGIDDKAASATAEIKTLSGLVNELIGKQMNLREAQRDMEAAIDDATEAWRRNGATLDINTKAGRENQAALDRLAEATNRAYQAALDQGAGQDAANAILDRGREKFLELAEAMGLDEVQAKRLADQLLQIKDRNVTVTVTSIVKNGQLIGFEKKIKQLDGTVITIHTRLTSVGEYIPGQGTQLKGFSRGGIVPGPGPKGVDSRAYLLAPGEGVLTADDVDAIGGPSGFERLRQAIRSGRPLTLAPAGAAPAGPAASAVGAPPVVRLEVRTGGAPMDELLAELIRRYVRVVGGGDVQAAFGG